MTVVGVDTGGTFTDVVDDSGAVVKVLSAPDDPARAVAARRSPRTHCSSAGAPRSRW
jgi:N-methylhydantoinase A/oxoprolinase/acetone carboxylase beta subunit